MNSINIYEVQHSLNDIQDCMRGGAPRMAVKSLYDRFGKSTVMHEFHAQYLFTRPELVPWLIKSEWGWSLVEEATSSPYWYWYQGSLRPMDERDLLNVFDTLALRVNVDRPEMDVDRMIDLYSRMYDQGKLTQVRDGLYCQFGDMIDSELQDRGFQDRHDVLERLGHELRRQIEDRDVEHDELSPLQKKLDQIEQIRTSRVPYWSLADSLGNMHERPIALSKTELSDIIESLVTYIE